MMNRQDFGQWATWVVVAFAAPLAIAQTPVASTPSVSSDVNVEYSLDVPTKDSAQ